MYSMASMASMASMEWEVIDKHVPLLRSGVAEHETVRLAKELTPRPPLHEGEKQPVQQKRGIRSAS
jgi:hypothetical protein